MPNGTLTYNSPVAPNSQGMPAFMQGADYQRDRMHYEDARSLQDLMSRMGAQKQMAVQPGQIAATNAQNQATSMYAVPKAGYETEGLRLANVGTDTANQSAALKYKGDMLKKAMADMDATIEASAVLSSAGANPASYSAFKQRLQESGVDPQLVQFFSATTSPEDLAGRLQHIKAAREKTNIEWAKIAAQLEQAKLQASAQGKPTDREQYFQRRVRELRGQGWPQAAAEAQANRDAAEIAVRAGGVNRPSPEQMGEEAGAKALNERATMLDTLAGLAQAKNPKKAAEYRAEAQRLRQQAGGGRSTLPGLEPASQYGGRPQPGATGPAGLPNPQAQRPTGGPKPMPIEQARQYLQKNDTPANRLFFERTYGVKP